MAETPNTFGSQVAAARKKKKKKKAADALGGISGIGVKTLREAKKRKEKQLNEI